MEVDIPEDPATAEAAAAAAAAAEAAALAAEAAVEGAEAAIEGVDNEGDEIDDAAIVELAQTLGELRAMQEAHATVLAQHGEAHARIEAAIERLSTRLEELNEAPEVGAIVEVPAGTLPEPPPDPPDHAGSEAPPGEQPEVRGKKKRHFV